MGCRETSTGGHLAIAALAAGALALFAAPALAAKCARPGGGGGCKATIQEAVEAAGPGETVYVYPGAYPEPVVVTAGKTGLKIVGRGRTPASVRLELAGIPARGIWILAADVSVRNLTVRGAQRGIEATGGGTRISRVRVFAAMDAGIKITGDHAQVAATQVKGCGAPGVEITGNDALVRGVSATFTGGILVTGDRGRVIGARATGTTGIGVMVSGASPLVTRSRVRGGNGVGIQISGTTTAPAVARMSRSSARGVLGLGLMASVSGPAVVSANVVQEVFGVGLLFTCPADCSGGRVSANVAGTTIIGSGFAISASTPGVVVGGNRASDNGASGFDIQGTGIDVHDNLAVGNGSAGSYGTPGTAGFLVDGSSHALRRNVALRNAQAGFLVSGSGLALTGNRAEGNLLHGFIFGYPPATAAGVALTGNRALGNLHYGFLLGANTSAATLTDNTARGNSFSPFCDQSPGPTPLTGNSFTSSLCTP